MIKLITKKTNNKKGFTLIELIVVIAILGILAAIAIPRFSSVTDTANDKAALADQRVVVSAVQMYMADNNGGLPADASDITPYIQGAAIPSTVTITYADPLVVAATSLSGTVLTPISVD